MNSTLPITSRIAFFLCILLFSSPVFSQKESVRYIGANGKITTLEHALKMEKIKSNSLKKITIQTFRLKDSKWEKKTTDQYKLINDSTYKIEENSAEFTGKIYCIFNRQADKLYKFKDLIKGSTVREGTANSIVPLILQGKVTEYYKSGKKRSESQYNNNELISNENWNEDGGKYIDNIFYTVDVDPIFQPGAQVINQRLMNAFKTAGVDLSSISGSLIIGFVVMENGKIEGVKVLKGLGPTINSVAFDTFANLKGEWTPAKLNNQNVRYFQVFPINFIYKTLSFEFAEFGKGSTLHWGAY